MSATTPAPQGHLSLSFDYSGISVDIYVHDDDSLEIFVAGCLRKRRRKVGATTYAWTDLELVFEDHHLIEAYLEERQGGRHLSVLANGDPYMDKAL